MFRVNNHLPLIQSNASDEVFTLKPCEVVLEKMPPECTEKVSRYPEDEGESDRDSGDSLFITQKPVPQPVRSRKNRHKLHLEEHGDDSSSFSSSSSSSSSDEPLRVVKKKKSRKYKLPEYRFPFLSRKCEKTDPTKCNRRLHDAGMVGFLRLVKELNEGSQTREDVESSLPAEGTDEDNISPLPEEEEEGSESEDIKVVERRLFAVPLKSKRQQTWCNKLQQKNIRNAANARQEPSQEKQFQASDKEPATTDTSRIEAGESELATTHGNSIQQPETQKTERLPEGEEEEEDTPCSEQMIKSKCVAESATLEVHGNLDSEFNVEILASSCEENGGEKQKSRSAEDEEQLQSRTVPNTQDDEADEQREKGEEIITEEERREEGNSMIAPEETPEPSLVKTKKKHLFCDDADQEEECADVSSLLAPSEIEGKSAKKKKKKRKNPEEVNNFPTPVENTNIEPVDNTQKKADEDQISEIVMKRKKKKRRKRESFSEDKSELGSAQGDDSVSVQERKRTSSFLGADAESLQTVEAPVTGAQNERDVKDSNDGVRKKRKKIITEKERREEGNSLIVPEDTPESNLVKTKKKHLSCNDAAQEEECADVSSSLALDENEWKSAKRKKKKRKNPEEVNHSPTPVENTTDEPFDNTQKEADEDQIFEIVMKRKKKKRRKTESFSEDKSELGSAHGDDSVCLQERKRTSSFLGADAESLQTAEAPVTGAQKPGADAPGLETESAENDRNMEEFNAGVKKKKRKDKKRKVLEMHDGVGKDQEQYSEEANTHQSGLSEEERPGVKRIKKHDVDELMSLAESLEGTADAGLPSSHETTVLKKKKKKMKDKTCHVIEQSPSAATEELVLFNVTSSNKSVNSEPEENKKEKKKRGRMQTAEENETLRSPSRSKSELTSSDRTKKNKHFNIKRRLYNPNEDFLSHF